MSGLLARRARPLPRRAPGSRAPRVPAGLGSGWRESGGGTSFRPTETAAEPRAVSPLRGVLRPGVPWVCGLGAWKPIC